MRETLQPDDANCLGSYAVYLHRIKKDYTAAEAMYKKVSPTVWRIHYDSTFHCSVESLGCSEEKLVGLFGTIRQLHVMLWQAVTLYPSHASVLTKYANFLKNVNNDMVKAEHYYRKVTWSLEW
jgi:hypothetical protein